ncbi:zinc finger protein 2 homolog [Limulus polyphemus]|uniref:Zinc finger protein 2 homolog n=1 Tax=Limulus polyphemus TaxID=6850 RepID=A0ABM1BPL6_LIMPO|nr:zinc finger protein 2 homolog [Limulus polyphemus]
MSILVKDVSSSETENLFDNESISDDWNKNRYLYGKPTESLQCKICNKVFISSSFLKCHTEMYHKGKECGEFAGVLCNEELSLEAKSFNGEDSTGDEDENHMFCSNSCNDSVNCEVQLVELMEDQPLNNIHKDENACSENQFSEFDENQEENEGTRETNESFASDIEMHKSQFCQSLFIKEGSLVNHEEQHGSSSSDEHHCTHCIFSSKSYSDLLTHLAIHQDGQEDEQSLRCVEGGKNFKAKDHQHQESDAQFQTVKCNICGSMFKKESGLAVHMRSHLKRVRTSQSCENVKLNSQEIIVRKINSAGDKRFHCSVCDRGFSCTNNLMKHYIAKHDPNNPNIPSTSFDMQKQDDKSGEFLSTDSYPCEKCGKVFTSMKMLEGHKKIHRNETENRRFSCPYCKYSTNKSTGLRNHVAIHTNERPYQCNYCGRGFTEQSSLRKHMLTHTGEKPYACDVCGKKFTQRGHINIHMRIHNKEKPYRCQFCEKTFAYHNVLTRHQKTHSEEKPYKCTYCSKSFKSKSAHQGHEISKHTHKYPVTCTECGKGFIEFRNMQIHLRNIHNIAIYKLKDN